MFKKEIYLILLVVSIFGFSTFLSCNRQSKRSFNEDLIPEKLSFQKANLISTSAKEIIIVEWDEWGRAKKGCKGWGLCNAVWFPDSEKNNRILNLSKFSTLLRSDSIKGEYFIVILLSKPVPKDVPIELYPLPIDESFILKGEEGIGKNLIFPEGKYQFDSSLGDFGGFRINLK